MDIASVFIGLVAIENIANLASKNLKPIKNPLPNSRGDGAYKAAP